MKVLIVYNKKSGFFGQFNLVEMVKSKLGNQAKKIDTFELLDWSNKIFDECGSGKYDLVVAIGGDGTVRRCATLILDYMPKARLRVIPAGSTNVLAASLGGSLNVIKEIERLKKISKLKEIKIDVGRLNEHEYFLEALMIGYLAKVVGATEQNMKNKMGFGGYLMTFFKHRKCPKHDFEVWVDGVRYEIKASTLMVINALSVMGIRPRKRIDFSDGEFELGHAKYDTVWGFLVSCFYFFFFQKSKAVSWLSGREIKIVQRDNQPMADVQVDGDGLDRKNNGELRVEVLEKRLKVLI